MGEREKSNYQRLIEIYQLSNKVCLMSLFLVVLLEILMLVFSVWNRAFYGEYVWRYRTAYLTLLAVSVTAIAAILAAKRNIKSRYRLLQFVNPLCSGFFYAWAIYITMSDWEINGIVDTTLFMTFSLAVPLMFYVRPGLYAFIVILTDIAMFDLMIEADYGLGVMINLFVFCLFQVVLGVGYLNLKENLAERIMEEAANSKIDVLTGFFNRRCYVQDISTMPVSSLGNDFVFISVDINGLKEVNDSMGHDAGDKLIVGAAKAMEITFGNHGRIYRMGGDEFVMMLDIKREYIDSFFERYERHMETWSKENGIHLTASYGYICHSEKPDAPVEELEIIADQRMYEAKDNYYRTSGKDRRTRRRPEQ